MASPAIADLVMQMRENVDAIHAKLAVLHDTKAHDDEIERLENERQQRIDGLKEKRDKDARALADKSKAAAEAVAERRRIERAQVEERWKKEADEIAEMRRKEEEEMMARRRREDEERQKKLEEEEAELNAIAQQEEEEWQALQAEEEEKLRLQAEEEENDLVDEIDSKMVEKEEEMERRMAEGQRALQELDERRKAINAMIDAQLSTPTTIPTFRRASKRFSSSPLPAQVAAMLASGEPPSNGNAENKPAGNDPVMADRPDQNDLPQDNNRSLSRRDTPTIAEEEEQEYTPTDITEAVKEPVTSQQIEPASEEHEMEDTPVIDINSATEQEDVDDLPVKVDDEPLVSEMQPTSAKEIIQERPFHIEPVEVKHQGQVVASDFSTNEPEAMPETSLAEEETSGEIAASNLEIEETEDIAQSLQDPSEEASLSPRDMDIAHDQVGASSPIETISRDLTLSTHIIPEEYEDEHEHVDSRGAPDSASSPAEFFQNGIPESPLQDLSRPPSNRRGSITSIKSFSSMRSSNSSMHQRMRSEDREDRRAREETEKINAEIMAAVMTDEHAAESASDSDEKDTAPAALVKEPESKKASKPEATSFTFPFFTTKQKKPVAKPAEDPEDVRAREEMARINAEIMAAALAEEQQKAAQARRESYSTHRKSISSSSRYGSSHEDPEDVRAREEMARLNAEILAAAALEEAEKERYWELQREQEAAAQRAANEALVTESQTPRQIHAEAPEIQPVPTWPVTMHEHLPTWAIQSELPVVMGSHGLLNFRAGGADMNAVELPTIHEAEELKGTGEPELTHPVYSVVPHKHLPVWADQADLAIIFGSHGQMHFREDGGADMETVQTPLYEENANNSAEKSIASPVYHVTNHELLPTWADQSSLEIVYGSHGVLVFSNEGADMKTVQPAHEREVASVEPEQPLSRSISSYHVVKHELLPTWADQSSLETVYGSHGVLVFSNEGADMKTVQSAHEREVASAEPEQLLSRSVSSYHVVKHELLPTWADQSSLETVYGSHGVLIFSNEGADMKTVQPTHEPDVELVEPARSRSRSISSYDVLKHELLPTWVDQSSLEIVHGSHGVLIFSNGGADLKTVNSSHLESVEPERSFPISDYDVVKHELLPTWADQSSLEIVYGSHGVLVFSNEGADMKTVQSAQEPEVASAEPEPEQPLARSISSYHVLKHELLPTWVDQSSLEIVHGSHGVLIFSNEGADLKTVQLSQEPERSIPISNYNVVKHELHPTWVDQSSLETVYGNHGVLVFGNEGADMKTVQSAQEPETETTEREESRLVPSYDLAKHGLLPTWADQSSLEIVRGSHGVLTFSNEGASMETVPASSVDEPPKNLVEVSTKFPVYHVTRHELLPTWANQSELETVYGSHGQLRFGDKGAEMNAVPFLRVSQVISPREDLPHSISTYAIVKHAFLPTWADQSMLEIVYGSHGQLIFADSGADMKVVDLVEQPEEQASSAQEEREPAAYHVPQHRLLPTWADQSQLPVISGSHGQLTFTDDGAHMNANKRPSEHQAEKSTTERSISIADDYVPVVYDVPQHTLLPTWVDQSTLHSVTGMHGQIIFTDSGAKMSTVAPLKDIEEEKAETDLASERQIQETLQETTPPPSAPAAVPEALWFGKKARPGHPHNMTRLDSVEDVIKHMPGGFGRTWSSSSVGTLSEGPELEVDKENEKDHVPEPSADISSVPRDIEVIEEVSETPDAEKVVGEETIATVAATAKSPAQLPGHIEKESRQEESTSLSPRSPLAVSPTSPSNTIPGHVKARFPFLAQRMAAKQAEAERQQSVPAEPPSTLANQPEDPAIIEQTLVVAPPNVPNGLGSATMNHGAEKVKLAVKELASEDMPSEIIEVAGEKYDLEHPALEELVHAVEEREGNVNPYWVDQATLDVIKGSHGMLSFSGDIASIHAAQIPRGPHPYWTADQSELPVLRGHHGTLRFKEGTAAPYMDVITHHDSDTAEQVRDIRKESIKVMERIMTKTQSKSPLGDDPELDPRSMDQEFVVKTSPLHSIPPTRSQFDPYWVDQAELVVVRGSHGLLSFTSSGAELLAHCSPQEAVSEQTDSPKSYDQITEPEFKPVMPGRYWADQAGLEVITGCHGRLSFDDDGASMIPHVFEQIHETKNPAESNISGQRTVGLPNPINSSVNTTQKCEDMQDFVVRSPAHEQRLGETREPDEQILPSSEEDMEDQLLLQARDINGQARFPIEDESDASSEDDIEIARLAAMDKLNGHNQRSRSNSLYQDEDSAPQSMDGYDPRISSSYRDVDEDLHHDARRDSEMGLFDDDDDNEDHDNRSNSYQRPTSNPRSSMGPGALAALLNTVKNNYPIAGNYVESPQGSYSPVRGHERALRRESSMHIRTDTADTFPSSEAYGSHEAASPVTPTDVASPVHTNGQMVEEPAIHSWQDSPSHHSNHLDDFQPQHDLKPLTSPLATPTGFDSFNPQAYVPALKSPVNTKSFDSSRVDPHDQHTQKSLDEQLHVDSQSPYKLPESTQQESDRTRLPPVQTAQANSGIDSRIARPEYERKQPFANKSTSQEPGVSVLPSPSRLVGRRNTITDRVNMFNQAPVNSSPTGPIPGGNSVFYKTRALFEHASTPSPPPPTTRPVSGVFHVSGLRSKRSSMQQGDFIPDETTIVPRSLDGDQRPPSPGYRMPNRASNDLSLASEQTHSPVKLKSNNPFLGAISQVANQFQGLNSSMHNPAHQEAEKQSLLSEAENV
ncbi:hypothetical protein BP6252_08336 [Coleophoma cylindrospora]|uniref:Uncharacterized protein n=1 Tax=Coleophoma cylindrospora TaxID=1849047 RepID=A0A3D8R5N7_9HELO|nr:hypothetical protein BP6252_08336 [Coleophoma cylindrospora]